MPGRLGRLPVRSRITRKACLIASWLRVMLYKLHIEGDEPVLRGASIAISIRAYDPVAVSDSSTDNGCIISRLIFARRNSRIFNPPNLCEQFLSSARRNDA